MHQLRHPLIAPQTLYLQHVKVLCSDADAGHDLAEGTGVAQHGTPHDVDGTLFLLFPTVITSVGTSGQGARIRQQLLEVTHERGIITTG
jgi:hypothetical protein